MNVGPVRKKYTIWQKLQEGGYFRRFECPDYPGLTGTEMQRTAKHKVIREWSVRSLVSPTEAQLSYKVFRVEIEAFNYWDECYKNNLIPFD